MIEVLTDYSGKRETLYLAVSMVDRFLCISPNFPVNKLQLVGIASLFIAYKLEEQVRPTARSFAETTGGKFSVEDLTDFEQ
jgi:flagellar biosynthesis component FlhA